MATVNQVYVEEIPNSEVFGTRSFIYHIYIKDVPGFAKNNVVRKSLGAIYEAAIIAGKALGFPVFDGTDGGKEIWTPPIKRKHRSSLVYPKRGRGNRWSLDV